MERKLASIRKITNIEPLTFINKDGVEETAEKIVKAQIDGWHIVTAKANGFKDGDLVVYFEVDSVLPKTSWSEFLVDVNRPDKPIRIKTIKLKGHVAQGLALPLDVVYETIKSNTTAPIESFSLKEGQDVTELLGVTKYEPPVNPQLAGVARGNFPEFLRKTDEERIQNCFEQLKPFFSEPFFVTEKIDGSSFTAYLKDDEFGVCSRNLDLKETDDNAFWKMAKELDLKERLKAVGRNVAVQGELAGPGIQKNKLDLPNTQLFIFNIFDIDDQEFYDYINFQVFTQKIMKLTSVPTWEIFSEGLPFESVDEIVEYVTRKSVLNDKVWAEGGVFRTKSETFVDRFGRLSFKAINPNFLLKFGE